MRHQWIGLGETLSPIDLPEPIAPLPHPLRWTTTAIATATLFLALTNAPAIRSWAYQLPPTDTNARIVFAAEAWHDSVGVNAPVTAMRGWWQRVKDLRFQSPDSRSARAYSSSASG